MSTFMNRATTVGFIGCGNMAQSIIKGLIDNKVLPANKIYASNRSPGKLLKLQETYQIQIAKTNEEVIENSEVVILAMKPQDLIGALDPLVSLFSNKQIVISLAAGITLSTLKRHIPSCRWIRLMPNTPTLIGQGLVGFLNESPDDYLNTLVEDLFKSLGKVVQLKDEDQFEAFMIACSSGTGFVFEFMLYWQDWLEEHGFDEDLAQLLTLETFLGASLLAQKNQKISIQELQNRVASKKGVTSAGLDSFRELEIERALRIGFEKASMRNQELAKLLK